MGYIHVDIPAIKQHLASHALKQADVCAKIGRSRSYISACAASGKMSSYAYTLLCRELGVVEDAFIRKEKPKAQEAPPRGGGAVFAQAPRIALPRDPAHVLSGHGDIQRRIQGEGHQGAGPAAGRILCGPHDVQVRGAKRAEQGGTPCLTTSP